MSKKSSRPTSAKSLTGPSRTPRDRPDHTARKRAGGSVEFEASITGYCTNIVRVGGNADYLGWLQLIGDSGTPVGYVYLRRPLQAPEISSQRDYVVLDWLPEQLDALLTILRSGEPLRIRYSGNAQTGWAFLERR